MREKLLEKIELYEHLGVHTLALLLAARDILDEKCDISDNILPEPITPEVPICPTYTVTTTKGGISDIYGNNY